MSYDDLNVYQTTETPVKTALTSDKINEMENTALTFFSGGAMPVSKREASSLGQGGYGNVEEHSGIYSYKIPIHVPTPQNGGPIPKISLVYNSRGSDRPNLIAAGWRLELGRIERVPETGGYMDFKNNQGTPDANNHFVLQLNGKSYTLVKVQNKDHVFRSKVENSFIEAQRFIHKDKLDPDSGEPMIDYWIVRSADGQRFIFGAQNDNGNAPGEVENKLWHLMAIKAPYGQKVVYEYEHYVKPGSPHGEKERSYSYPTCVKVGMTPDRTFWDTEIRFIYREDDPYDPSEGYYYLDTDYTGREDSGFVAAIWKRIVAVETYFRNPDGEMTLSRRVKINASIHEGAENFWVDTVSEDAFKNGDLDSSCHQPPHQFEYRWQDPQNPAMMSRSTNPFGKIKEVEYDLAMNVDKEAFGVEGIFLVTAYAEKASNESWRKTFEYLGGKLYSPFGEYRGHRRIIATDQETNMSTETHFIQTGVHNGHIARQYKRDALNNLISSIENTWMAVDYNGGRFLPFKQRTEERKYAEDGVTLLSRKIRTIPETGQTHQYAIDIYGNALVEIETVYEDENEESLVLQKKTEKEYLNITSAHEGESFCFIGLTASQKTWAKNKDVQDFQLIEFKENTYNDRGQVTEAIEHVDSEDPEHIRKKAFEYHPVTGQITKKLRFNEQASIIEEENQFFTEGPYQFLKQTTINAMGHAEHAKSYDLQNRKTTFKIQKNGTIAMTAYDGLGRTIEETYTAQGADNSDLNFRD